MPTSLLASEGLFRGLLEAAPDAMIIVAEDGRIVLVNTRAEKLFAWPREELVGKVVEDLIPERFRKNHPSLRGAFFVEPHVRNMGAGLELYGLRRDGTEFPVEISLSPMQTDRGLVVIAAVRDATEWRRAEERFRGLLEAAPDAMVIVDERGKMQLVNSQTEKLFGWSRQELLGQPVELLVPERFGESHVRHRNDYSRTPRTRNMGTGLELYGRRKDGSEFPVEVSLSPLVTPEGRLVTAAVRDISERKRAEEELAARAKELERSNAELEQFAYVASHDLQEPLRMVGSYTQLLARRYRGKLDADADEFIGFATDGVVRMQALIKDLLAYSRVNRRGGTVAPTPIGDAVDEAVQNLSRSIADAGAVVTHAELPTLVVDRSQLVQLFQNLIGNAVKFRGASPPRVTVSAAPDAGGGWTFSVRDNGIGIDPKYFDRIFVIFQRLHSGDRYPGTGIGLAICKKIVERHGGRIWVESSPEGSDFRFTIRSQPANETDGGTPPTIC